MAFLKCFAFMTLLAAYAHAQQTCTTANEATTCVGPTYGGTCLGDNNCNCGAGYVRITGSACIAETAPALTCTADTTCTASTDAHVGDTCETPTVGTTQKCNCKPVNYVRVGDDCVVNHVACGGNTNNDCTVGNPFTGTCPVSNECACSMGYEAVTGQCKVEPAKPTLSVQDGNGATVTGDLIHGSSYTLVCASTGAPGNIPYSYSFSKGSTVLQSASLNTVTQTDNGGSYTCKASYDGVDSASSDASTLRVKPVKPTLQEEGGAPLTDLSEGGTYRLLCSSAGAPTDTTTYTYTKGSTTLTSQDLTSVTTASAAGAYYCVATISGVASDQSDTVNVAVGAAGTYCTGTSNCNGDSYTGVCTAARCICASGYEARGAVCSPQPAKPTLKVDGGHDATDLSAGGAYTLVCESADAPTGTTYTFSKGNTGHTGTFAEISTSDDGAYTCVATSGAGVQSAASDALTITVGAAGTFCNDNSRCSGNSYSGTCTTKRCVCASGYIANGVRCAASGKSCTSNAQCTGTGVDPNCVNSYCNCASTYVKSTNGCEIPPGQPTLSLSGNHEQNDLSAGASYTLDCTLTNAATETTFEFYRGSVLLSTGSLTSVSDDDDGSYTCLAYSATGAQSAASVAFDIAVGASGKRCTANSGCTAGNGFTGTCTTTTNRCACSSGYQARGDTCSSAVQAATISMFSILLALVVSKLL